MSEKKKSEEELGDGDEKSFDADSSEGSGSEAEDRDSVSDVNYAELYESVRAHNAVISRENDLLAHFWEDAEKRAGASETSVEKALHKLSIGGKSQEGFNSEARRPSRSRSKSVVTQPLLSLPVKCYMASRRLEELQQEQQALQKSRDIQVDNLKAKFEEVDIEKSEINLEMKEFNTAVRIGAKHPVTKKVMAEKVEKYLSDVLKKKLVATERLKMQTAECRAKRKKTLDEISQKKEALRLLHDVDIEKTRLEHLQSLALYNKYEKQYFDYRARLNRLLQDIADLKKALEKEEGELSTFRDQVRKKERSKDVFELERSTINKEKQEYKDLKRKIESNPRCGYLPAVMDYVRLQTDLELLVKNVRTWRSKVEAIERASAVSVKQR